MIADLFQFLLELLAIVRLAVGLQHAPRLVAIRHTLIKLHEDG